MVPQLRPYLHEAAGSCRRLKEQKRQKQHVRHADAVPKPPKRRVRPDECRLRPMNSRVALQGDIGKRSAGAAGANAGVPR